MSQNYTDLTNITIQCKHKNYGQCSDIVQTIPDTIPNISDSVPIISDVILSICDMMQVMSERQRERGGAGREPETDQTRGRQQERER